MSITSESFLNASMERKASGVSWGAIIAGAAAAASLSIILLVLGVGLGFSAISPWPHQGIGASALGASSIAWLVLTQILASGAGGYLAGRLRIKWATVHTDEVYFRDTAHGFLAWAVAALTVASLIGGVTGNVLSSGASAGTTLAAVASTSYSSDASAGRSGASSSTATHDARQGQTKYLVDSLFRPAPSAPEAPADSDTATRAEAEHIFANSFHSENLPAQDQQYLAQQVAKRTGLSEADANKRVGDTFTIARDAVLNAEQTARQAADAARKTAAYSALWMFVSLLCGAFMASLFATLGGKQRDRVVHVEALI